jgi:hypothetical protein
VFDDPNLVASAGVVPVMALAERCGLRELIREWVGVPGPAGTHADLKAAWVVGGMVTGADSIDDLGVVRHGGIGRLSAGRGRRPRWARFARVHLGACGSWSRWPGS